MRAILRSGLAVVFLAVASTAHADSVTVGDMVTFADGPGTTGGGEFILTVNGFDSFLTFCLQRTEYMDFKNTFKVGGVTSWAMTDPAANGGDASGKDPIGSQTAWLYTQFRAGTLTGYRYTDSANRWKDANTLQQAIWYFENEMTLANPNGNKYVVAANQAVTDGWKGIGNVRVLNLYKLNGAEAQDQLVLVPEPASLSLLGSGMLAFWFRRRRMAGRSDRGAA